MVIAGVLLPSTSLSLLVRCLDGAGEHELAQDIGVAVDANRQEMRLGPGEERAILGVLRNCPHPLQPLRDALEATTRRA